VWRDFRRDFGLSDLRLHIARHGCGPEGQTALRMR
jgi:hypothetical protein